MPPIPEIRRLRRADADAYDSIRAEMLRRHPEAFGDSLAEHRARGLASVRRRLEGGEETQVFGAFDGARLVAVAGFFRESSRKARHVATIWGVYTRPAARGRGLSAALIRRALDVLRPLGVDLVTLDVGSRNRPAICVYEALGFRKTGTLPRALRVGGRDHDEDRMVLDLRPLGRSRRSR